MLNRFSVIQLNGKHFEHFLFKCKPRTLTTRRNIKETPSSVFVEKCEEDPVIVISEKNDVDIIGPPDLVSNLRPIFRKKFPNETELQQQLREMQNATQLWNQQFWAKHNTKFIKERQAYIDEKLSGREEKGPLSAEEMSEFYKQFLDKNWEVHVRYNFEWYGKNFALCFLALRVCLEKNLARWR